MSFLRLILLGWVTATWGLMMPAAAFGLHDHEQLTLQSVQELNACFPGVIDQAMLNTLVQSNLDEDLNFFRKWTEFSHYYNPERNLEMFRLGSMDRIESLMPELKTSEKPTDEMGHMIHHVQDAAAPPHVVPVNHWLTDGFEGFEQGVMPALQVSVKDCQKFHLPRRRDPVQLLKETATATLEASRSPLLTFENRAPVLNTWARFWTEGSQRAFGEYGDWGNSFGTSDLEVDGVRIEVPVETYRTFKLQQLRLAIDNTIQVLLWKLKP